MKIGIIDVDGHAAKTKKDARIYPNLADMKIAAYHKAQGDDVEWATPFEHYDILYMSKVFNYTPDDLTCYNADKIIKGGTGYDIYSKLPDEIDRMQPDYSFYPNIDKDVAYGFLTRGCPNKCKWCVVPRKEGMIRPYMDIDEIANGRKKIILMDNNILAAGQYCIEQLNKIIERGYRIDFNQAIDARLVTDENAQLLAKIKWIDNRIRFGCDTQGQIKECERAIELINSYGFHGEYFLFTMLNDNFKECFNRVNYWRTRTLNLRSEGKHNDMMPFSQPYRDPDNPKHQPPQWQKDMARWALRRQLFLQTEFKDYEPRKGFKCKEYFND